MKKKLLIVCLFSILVASSCSEKEETGTMDSSKIDDVKTKNIKIENWKEAALLPNAEGFDKSIGVSGAFAGFINDKLVVAGGANFPYKPVLEGGSKEFYSDIFVFDVMEDNTLKHVGSGQLPKKLATGGTVSFADDVLYFVGGENAEGDSSSVYSIKLNGDTPIVEEVFTLPFTFAAGAAMLDDNDLYIVGGRQNKKSSNATFKIDLNTKNVTQLEPLPGEARVQMPYAITDDKIYIFTGLGALTLTDNYVYDITSNLWSKLADTTINNKSYTLGGAAAVAIDDDYILILGGVNKDVFDDAVTQLSSLKDEALQAFKNDYFNRTPEEFNFSKEEVVYDIKNNKWYSIGTTPFYGNAGPFPVLLGDDDTIWRVSGEIKAAIRTPDIQVGTIIKN